MTSDSPLGMRAPFRFLLVLVVLASLVFTVAATPPDDSVVLNASEDSYVVADVSTTDDPQSLRDKNFGGLDFLKIWYANQVQSTEQVVSVGLVKFDLSSLSNREIRSASLQLFAQRADLMQPVRLVDVSVAQSGWTASDVTFNKLPQITNPPLASAAVYGANVWYSWDVTPAAVSKTNDGTVSYAIGLRTLETKGEEQVVFASTSAGRNAPRLLVTMAPAAATLPPYVVAGGIVVAAIIAFAGGLLLGRARRSRRAAPAMPMAAMTPAPAPAAARVDNSEAVIECPSCNHQIPAAAEICPRCGSRVGEPLVR